MNIHSNKSTWKLILILMGVGILLVTMLYSNYLAKELEKKELWQSKVHSMAVEENINNPDLGRDLKLISEILDEKHGVPVILEAEDGALSGSFWPDSLQDGDEVFLEKKVTEFLKEGKTPIEGVGYANKVYYFNTPLLDHIKLFPLAQIGLLGLFIGLGYFLFSSARNAEQNRVWAGMAKETAHQLGTPISAIMGWIEHLRMTADDNPDQLEVVEELQKDVDRLNLVADRFSKIGSEPELEPVNIVEELEECKDYMKRRSPRRIVFDFPEDATGAPTVMINRHLFDWVVENLMRNALDAMDREGKITTKVYHENNYVCIDLSDTGKGIPSNKFKRVFEPGFSTKQRGWGLGLSLSKRIIQDYHKGKIYVKDSKLGQGTTFTIKLPKAV